MFKVRQAFSKLTKMRKKWLINVSEERDMINATHDNGMSLKQILIFFFDVNLFLVYQSIR